MPVLTSPDRRLELSHAVNRLSDAILRGDTTNDILQSLVDIAGPTLCADRALIYDVSYSRGTAIALCEWLDPASHVSATKNTYSLSLFATAARETARTGAPLESSRTNVHPHLAADGADELLHHQMSIQRLLWYPIRRFDDGCYLLVLNQVRQDRGWTPEEHEFIGVVAGQVNLAADEGRAPARTRANRCGTAHERQPLPPVLRLDPVNVLHGGPLRHRSRSQCIRRATPGLRSRRAAEQERAGNRAPRGPNRGDASPRRVLRRSGRGARDRLPQGL